VELVNYYKQTNYRRKALNLYYSVLNRIIRIPLISKKIPPQSLTLETQFYQKKIRDNSYPDYIRLSSLDMISKEIYSRKIQGSVAEVGVFQGDFARYINRFFQDRTLYLFDTFEGFDERDLSHDEKSGYYKLDQDFSRTNVDFVLERMADKDKCIIKKGYFPESLEGLEDKFCFVSLDTDLYKPIIDGLNYFFPRLSEGGYIFIHDYNNYHYLGVKEAVDEFLNDNEACIVPVPDWGGTLALMKPLRNSSHLNDKLKTK
jgi:O-methyltransferase